MTPCAYSLSTLKMKPSYVSLNIGLLSETDSHTIAWHVPTTCLCLEDPCQVATTVPTKNKVSMKT